MHRSSLLKYAATLISESNFVKSTIISVGFFFCILQTYNFFLIYTRKNVKKFKVLYKKSHPIGFRMGLCRVNKYIVTLSFDHY